MRESGSFTERVIAELAPHTPPLACCRRALIEGMRLVSDLPTTVSTTRLVAARAAVSALHAESVPAHVTRAAAPRRVRYVLEGFDLDALGSASLGVCCTRSRVRGALLAAGRLTRPARAPYLEIGSPRLESAAQIAADLTTLGVTARVRRRRERWVVTVRTTQAVGMALSSVGAQSGRLDFEAGRVVREVGAGVNRRLNAETANLRRTVAAGVRQLGAVTLLINDPHRWASLPPAVREAALLRQRHPDDDFAALAARAGCSRSAMAGRLHRLEGAAAAAEGNAHARRSR